MAKNGTAIPADGSKWSWDGDIGCSRQVYQTIDGPCGVYVLYYDTLDTGLPVHLRLCSLNTWAQAESGSGKYFRALIPWAG